ncbi:MAG: phosphatidate cytidylyltransferase [Salibacteraceae bacterium]
MSNLIQRTLSSIAFVALMIGPIFLSGRIAFSIYTLLGGLTLREMLSLLEKAGSEVNKTLAAATYGLAAIGAYLVFFEQGSNLRVVGLSLIVVVILGLVAEVFTHNSKPFERFSTSVLSPLFAASSFLCLPYFFVYRTDLPSTLITLSLFGFIWINDSAAYLAGRKIGKRPLFKRLSPNKTWEGSISGLIASLATGFLIGFSPGTPPAWFMVGFSLVCVIFGSLGDLLESRLKRVAGVKDSGKFLPGHGGFFDRFDAMMLAVPASLIYFEALLPKN